MKRVGIDGRFLGVMQQGFGRFTKELVSRLTEQPDIHYVLFVMREARLPEIPSSIEVVRVNIPWYSLKEQISWVRILNRHKLDLMHFIHFNVPLAYRKPFIVTVHDLILLHESTSAVSTRHPLTYAIKYRAYRLALRHAVRNAKKIATISKYTKDELISYFKIPESRVEVIYNGADGVSTPTDLDADRLHARRYFLYVGNAYPHKNLDTALTVFESIQADITDVDFVLIGKHDYFYRKLMTSYTSPRIRFVGEVSDAELSRWYRDAEAYVLPSRHEGFGMPPLEAMRSNIPVIANRASVIPEILGDAAFYIDAKNPLAFAEGYKRILNDSELRLELIKKGALQAQKFRWSETAKAYEGLYRTACS